MERTTSLSRVRYRDTQCQLSPQFFEELRDISRRLGLFPLVATLPMCLPPIRIAQASQTKNYPPGRSGRIPAGQWVAPFVRGLSGAPTDATNNPTQKASTESKSLHHGRNKEPDNREHDTNGVGHEKTWPEDSQWQVLVAPFVQLAQNPPVISG